MNVQEKRNLQMAMKAGAYAILYGMPKIGDSFWYDISGKEGGPYSIKFDDAVELLLNASLIEDGEEKSEVQNAEKSDL